MDYSNYNQFDLRFFRSFVNADTYNGEGTASDGQTVTFYFYKKEYLGAASVDKISGQTQVRGSNLTDDQSALISMADEYQAILRKARSFYGLEKDPNEKKKLVIVNDVLQALRKHPQMIGLLSSFKDVGIDISFKPNEECDHLSEVIFSKIPLSTAA